MLRTDLIETLNQGRMWAFVGSGASAAAGCPTWRQLVDGVVTQLPNGRAVRADDRFADAYAVKAFEKCLSRAVALGGRNTVRDAIYGLLRPFDAAGPFTAYWRTGRSTATSRPTTTRSSKVPSGA